MSKYEDHFLGKIDFLHERYHKTHNNLTNYLEILRKYKIACNDFSKSLGNIIKKNYEIYEDKTSTIYTSIESISLNIKIQSEEFAECSDFIQTKIIDLIKNTLSESLNKEKNFYSKYIKSCENFKISQKDLETSKSNFESKSKISENCLLNSKALKYSQNSSQKEVEKSENRANESLHDAVTYENKYFAKINETNKLREEKIKSEIDLLNLYQEIDIDFYNKIKCIVSFYIATLKKVFLTISNDISWMNEKFKNLNEEKDFNNFIEKNKSHCEKEKEIEFIPYKPTVDINSYIIPYDNIEQDQNQNNINYEVIFSLKEKLRDVRPDLKFEEEDKKKRLRYLCSKIFQNNSNISFLPEEKTELLKFMKEKFCRKYFLIVLSKQRIKGKFKRPKKLLEELAEILDFILEEAEKCKDFDNAKNCMILGQTFYCEYKKNTDGKMYQKYLFKFIKNDKWYKKKEFWEEMIEFMIETEIKKNINLNLKNYNNPVLRQRTLANVGFSQILPYTQNMLDLNFSKEQVTEIAKKFIEKYKLEDSFAEVIYNNIKESNKIIEDEKLIEEEKNDEKILKRMMSLNEDGEDNKREMDDVLQMSVVVKKPKLKMKNIMEKKNKGDKKKEEKEDQKEEKGDNDKKEE